jgi:catechol 2,3-dioxygenase-like lactoylglutathione lyase family enzyme
VIRDDAPRLRPGRLQHVELATPTPLAEVTDFYRQWGLEVVHETPDSVALRGLGTAHHVVRFVSAERCGLGHVAFGASSRPVVDELHRRWAADGVEIRSEPGPLTTLGGGYGFDAADPEGRVLRVVTEMIAADPRPEVSPVPLGITHVVLNTVDIDLLCSFYVEVLGFAVSDWSEHQMVFLRNGPDHHTIAFNQGEHPSVNHVAYELASLDHFLTSVGRMKAAGVEPLWGIGRHGPGNNCFAYYGDPAGFVPELTAEVQQIDDEGWVPRVWQRIPAQSDLWHLAGPPSAEFRRVGAGASDPDLHPPRWPR